MRRTLALAWEAVLIALPLLAFVGWPLAYAMRWWPFTG